MEDEKCDRTESSPQEHIDYRSILDALDALIYVCSQDFRIEFRNERLMERTGYNAVGEFCFRALHNRDTVCPWCVNERVLRGEDG